MSDDTMGYDDFDDEDGGAGLPAQLRDPLGILQRQRKWILSSLVLFLIGAGVATALFPLVYEARATILLTEKSIPDNFVPTTILANILEQFDAIRGVVFTRQGLGKIVTESGIYAEDQSNNVPIATLAERLSNALTVERIAGNTGTRHTPRSISFEIKMSGKDPQKLADVVNLTVGELIEANIEYRSRQARTTTEFMQREFDRADEALRSHQRKLEQFRAEHRGGSLPEEQGTSLSRLSRLEDQRRSAILQISDLRERLERLETTPTTAVSESGLLANLRAELENARAIYTAEHPTVISLERRLRELETATPDSTPRTDPAQREEYAQISRQIRIEQERLAQIDADVRRLEQRLVEAPEIAEEYAAMIREEQILQENYVDFLRKLNSAELALSLEHSQQGAQLTRLDTAVPPRSPVIPRWLVGTAGIVASIAMALFVGIAMELISPVIIDTRHLEDTTHIPCLGSISEIT